MRSRACTPGCAAASVRAATSRPSRQRSSASTSPSAASTLRVEANNDGAPVGSPPSTPSPSPSKDDSQTLSTNRGQRSYTVLQTDPLGAPGLFELPQESTVVAVVAESNGGCGDSV